MPVLPITSIFAAVSALALVALSIPVSLRRTKVGVMAGECPDETLHRRIRAQGNFIEYVPLGLISLGLVEAQAAQAWMVVVIGTILAFGRLLHAIGMLRGSPPVRGFGMLFTYLALVVAAGRLLLDTGSWRNGDDRRERRLRPQAGNER
ncbi:MAPEG family protein [Bradyrhizobium sp. Pear76]|uniref:MAPEG family protein n=1 Tax=Bradyrhizobium oropedii TaxID=1571201 RepID=UPI001E2CAC00|nr:MAPEG family protein [Bradyrhizobium oropedii]MCC8962252.1 MAPEG family protein [Bradyrhizobium oropedii]